MIKRIYLKPFATIFFLCWMINIEAQDCQCTVAEVENSSVQSCDIVVGSIVTVNSVTAFLNAINEANSNQGNMTILIEDGSYQVASTSSFPYLTANNVVIRSASGNRDGVILEGGGMIPSSSTENGFLIAGDNVTIADLTIREVGNHGIQVSGHNLMVYNVKIQNTYEQMIKGSTSQESIDGATVQCSLFEYTAGIGPNWYIGGLDIHKGVGWFVSDNVFRNIVSPSQSVSEHAIHFWDNSADNTIERNLIINCDRGIGFGLGSSPNSGGVIRNNMIYNDGTGIFNDVGIGLETSPNTDVYNNTIHIAYQNAIEYRFEATTSGNIINNLTNKLIASRNGGTANVENNVETAESNWYSDIASGDLHLTSNISEVVDQGLDLSEFFTDDFDKNLRPTGSQFDIGANEYLSAVGIIDEIERSDFITVFPNPSHGLITVRVPDISKDLVFIISDIHGRVVYKKNLQNEDEQIELNDFFKCFSFLSGYGWGGNTGSREDPVVLNLLKRPINKLSSHH